MARVSPLTNVHSLRRKRQLVQLYWNECRCPLFRRLLCSGRPQPFPHTDWIFEIKYDGGLREP